jgi:hypothetical protein
VPQEGDHDPGAHAGDIDRRLQPAALVADPVRVMNAGSALADAEADPIALIVEGIVVGAPVLGVPRAIRLARRFISRPKAASKYGRRP